MKKYSIVAIALLFAVTAGLLYYYVRHDNVQEVQQNDAREVVWKQLSAQQKEEIDGTWSDGNVSKVALLDVSSGAARMVTDTPYVGKEVVLVRFPSINDATLGDVRIYADVNTYRIIGYGMRD